MPNYFKTFLRQKRFILMLGDAFIVLCSFLLSYLFRITIYEGESVTSIWERLSWLLAVVPFIHIIIFYIFELYGVQRKRSDSKQLLLILASVFLATCFIIILSFFFPEHRMGRILLGSHMPLLVIGIFFWRKFSYPLIANNQFKKNLIILDLDPGNSMITDQLEERITDDYNWIGVASGYKENPGTLTMNGDTTYRDLESLITENSVGTIVLSKNPKHAPNLKNQLIDFKFKGIEIFDFPTFYQSLFRRMPVLNTNGSYLLFSHQEKPVQPFFYLRMKRILDFLMAGTGLILSFPVLLLVAAVIKLTSKGPLFFTQERLGFYEKPFTLIKFRTMVENAEKDCGPKWSSCNDTRITKLGKCLRKTRLDEIPQLINVLKGEMSLVGPRPIRRYFADRLSKEFPFYRLRFSMKPGITGWAQVKGDYAGSQAGQLRKLEYELYYIQNRSLFFDLYILLKTVQTVLFRPGQ